MNPAEVSARLEELAAKVKALEDFMLDGYSEVRGERDLFRTSLEAIRSGAVHAVEQGEGEACDCARLATEVLDRG